MSECFKFKRKKELEKQKDMPNALVRSLSETVGTQSGLEQAHIPDQLENVDSSDSLREEFLPFVSKGYVSLNENSSPVPIRILRDTSASQSLLLQDTLCFGDETATGDSVLIQGAEGEFVSVPLHTVPLWRQTW